METYLGKQLGDYRLIRLLASGGFALVYLGEHIRHGKQVAIKVLHTYFNNQRLTQGFHNEARVIVNLRHPNIVQVLEFGTEKKRREANGTLYIVMDYAPGGTLAVRHPRGTQVPLSITIGYVNQMALALQYLHDLSFVHRDVKPSNMLVGRNGELLLGDLGIALTAASMLSETAQEMVGRPNYMAPEWWEGTVVQASDQYALGAVIYEWLTGVPPFQDITQEVMTHYLYVPPRPLRDRIPAIPEAVAQVVMKALAKNSPDRFPSVQDFALALEQASASLANQPPQTENTQSSPLQTRVFSASLLPSTFLKKDFFISYNKANSEWAWWVAAHLQQAGYTVLLPPVDFRDGFIFKKEMEKALTKADQMIAILSSQYLKALRSRKGGLSYFKQVMRNEHKPLLTLCIDAHESIADVFSGMEYLDLTRESDANARKMLLAYLCGDGIDGLPPLPLPPGHPFTAVSISSFTISSITTTADEVIQQARSSFTRNDWLDVASKVDLLIQRHPDRVTVEIYRMHGLAYIELNNQPRAYESLRTALTLAKDHERPMLLEDCVKVLKTLGRWREILECAKEALQQAPENSFWLKTHYQAFTELERSQPVTMPRTRSMQTTSSPILPNGIEVFFSYSHKDKVLIQELDTHLGLLKRQESIRRWYDGEIAPGDEWEQEINTHLHAANVILLLISPDFISSDYCYKEEMTYAMERYEAGTAWVIPIILRPTHWERSPFGKLQALPAGGLAITSWPNRDEAFLNVIKGIQKVIDELSIKMQN